MEAFAFQTLRRCSKPYEEAERQWRQGLCRRTHSACSRRHGRRGAQQLPCSPCPVEARLQPPAPLARGDVLMAYDAAVSAMEADPENLESGFVAALTLARAGADERARTSATELLARIDITANVPVKLREDALP